MDPVTLDEAREQCRVDYSDDDTIIERLISAATSLFDGEGELGRAIITQSWTQWEPVTTGRIRLKMGPFQSLVSVEHYVDGVLQSANVADFDIRPVGDFVTVGPVGSWPQADARDDAFKITYFAGFGDVPSAIPQGIRHAILLTVGHWYENREAFTDRKLMELPQAVSSLIGNHRVGWYG